MKNRLSKFLLCAVLLASPTQSDDQTITLTTGGSLTEDPLMFQAAKMNQQVYDSFQNLSQASSSEELTPFQNYEEVKEIEPVKKPRSKLKLSRKLKTQQKQSEAMKALLPKTRRLFQTKSPKSSNSAKHRKPEDWTKIEFSEGEPRLKLTSFKEVAQQRQMETPGDPLTNRHLTEDEDEENRSRVEKVYQDTLETVMTKMRDHQQKIWDEEVADYERTLKTNQRRMSSSIRRGIRRYIVRTMRYFESRHRRIASLRKKELVDQLNKEDKVFYAEFLELERLKHMYYQNHEGIRLVDAEKKKIST